MALEFEWDLGKAAANRAKHGVARIISAREATRRERGTYEHGTF